MLKNSFLVPPSLDFRKSLIGLQLFSPLLGPWHACLWAEGRRPGHPGTGQMLGLRGGSGGGSETAAAAAATVAVLTAAAEVVAAAHFALRPGLHCTLVCSPWCGGGVSALTVPTCE